MSSTNMYKIWRRPSSSLVTHQSSPVHISELGRDDKITTKIKHQEVAFLERKVNKNGFMVVVKHWTGSLSYIFCGYLTLRFAK